MSSSPQPQRPHHATSRSRVDDHHRRGGVHGPHHSPSHHSYSSPHRGSNNHEEIRTKVVHDDSSSSSRSRSHSPSCSSSSSSSSSSGSSSSSPSSSSSASSSSSPSSSSSSSATSATPSSEHYKRHQHQSHNHHRPAHHSRSRSKSSSSSSSSSQSRSSTTSSSYGSSAKREQHIHHHQHHRHSTKHHERAEPPKEPTNQSEVELEVIIHEPINVTSLTPPVPTESIASTQNPDATPPAKKRNPFRSLSVRQWFLVSELIFLSVAVMFVELCLVPALPEIMKQFYEDSDWVPWILSIYNIIGAVWTPISGSLADMFGPKWITIASLSVYMIGQVVCALSSSSIFVLIAGRALQGFGMAIFVLGLTIVRTSFPDELVTPLMGIISSMMSIGMSIGIVGGAAALEQIKWHSVFWITFPIIFLFTVALAITMPGIPKCILGLPCCKKYWPDDDGNTSVEDADADDEGPMTMRKRFFKMDVIGAFLLAAGVIMILMSFTLSDSWGWDDVGTLCLVIIGFCLLVVLVFWELWVPHPIIPVKSLLNRNQLVLIFVSVTSGLAQFALFQMLPYLYMEPSMAFKVEPSDMLQVGLYLLPFGVAMIAAMPGALGFGMTLGYPVANVVSSAVTVLGIGLMIEYHDTVAQTVILNTVAGVGLGMLTIAIINMITVISKSDEFGAISGANLCLKFVGGSLGPVLVTIFLNKHSYTIAYSVSVSDSSDGYETHYYTGYSEQSFKDAFIFLTAVTGAALIGSCSLSGMFKFLTAKGRKEIRDLAKMSAAGH